MRPASWRDGSHDGLQDVHAERSWVFDQAPVTVVPTRNVVGHVQIYRPPDAGWIRDVVAYTGRPVDELLVIGRLFVKPSRHGNGIARYLLTESVTYVETRGALAVLDPADLAFVEAPLYTKLGFTQIETGARTVAVLARE